MRPLLVDSDAFCKLGIVGLLEAALAVFGVGVDGAGCLPALPHMLRRGKLRRLFGDSNCDGLIATAESMTVPLAPSIAWLDKLAGVDKIDIGEAQLFAAAAETSIIVITGDKRALRAVAGVPDVAEALAGRVVTLEAVLLALCAQLGDEKIRGAVVPLATTDKTVQMCFSAGNSDPRGALQSYFGSLKREVDPLRLWEPSV